MTAVAERPTTVSARPSRSWWLLVAMPAGPLAVGLIRFLIPYYTAGGNADIVRAVVAQPGRESAVLWLGLVAVLTLVPGVYAAGRLAGSSRLTTVALALVVPAYLCLGGLLSQDLVLWSGVHAGVDQAAIVRLLDAVHPTVNISVGIFVLGHVVGTVLLGLALLRSGRIPAPVAWAVVVSQPLHFVATVFVGSPGLDLFGWSLTALGMGWCAVALTSGGQLSEGRDI